LLLIQHNPVTPERILFDTSCIVSALLQAHPEHARTSPWLNKATLGQVSGFIAAHSLAETYAILTRLPQGLRATPRDALTLIKHNLTPLEIVTLSVDDYLNTVERMVNLGLPGGGIYDALIAKAALVAKVDILLTLNSKDFTRLGSDVDVLVREP
jgi:predicted nucleic acid-binding protein